MNDFNDLENTITNAVEQADKEIEEEFEKILLDNGTNNKEIENLKKSTTIEAKRLFAQVQHYKQILEVKQNRILELEEALRKQSFQRGDTVQTEMRIGLSAEEEFNVMNNRGYYIVLH